LNPTWYLPGKILKVLGASMESKGAPVPPKRWVATVPFELIAALQRRWA
jgi:hypothetical protein